jgi:DNA-binding transcriptional LysR family regulator
MEINQVRNFIVLAECNSMTLAAERLFISQSALSRQIKALEEELGLTLFDRVRGSRGLSLTAAGERMLELARDLISQTEQIHLLADRLQRGTSGLVRVSAPPASLHYVVLPALARFQERWPAIDVTPVESAQDEMFTLVEDGRVDIAVGTTGPPPHQLRWDTLFIARLYALVSPHHPLATKASLTAGELSSEKILLYRPSYSAQRARDLIFHLIHMQSRLPAPVFESYIPATTLALAELGQGTAIISDVVPFVGYDLRAIPVLHQGRQVETRSVVAWSRRRRLSEATRAFIDVLKQHAAERTTKGYNPWVEGRGAAAIGLDGQAVPEGN